MEANSIPSGILPRMGSGVLGLEMPLHHPHRQNHPHHQNHPHPHQLQNLQNQNPFSSHQPQHQMVTFSTHESDPQTQTQQSVKQVTYPFTNKIKQQQQPQQQPQQQQIALSDEEEHGLTADDGGGGGGDGRKRGSPWQRVKWTDNMVRLLIMVVFYVGDDVGSEGNDHQSGNNCKKKSGGGLLQKKGKWKSVSRAMMEKGFYVSPQQCEDKFNDLNKRYKRVNDILGKGTACRVVENQNLLESMDHITPKMKEEVKKLLNSKHLFFREMCAYHNSGIGGAAAGACGGGGSSGGAVGGVAESSLHHQQQQKCFHSSQSAAGIANSRTRVDTDGSRMVVKGGVSHEEEDDEDGEDEDDGDEDDEDDEEEEDEELIEDGRKRRKRQGDGHDDEYEDEKMVNKKRQRKGSFGSSVSPLMQQFSSELMKVLQDGTKSPWERRQWMRTRTLQLEEQRVSYQCQAYELEKQHLKWVKFSEKKEREMERLKLNNERMRLENDRMVLLLRQKELEFFDLHHQQQQSSNKRPEPSSMTG